MAANGYDRPADAVIMNTYVPIDFGNLYRVGAAQKLAVDQAMAEMSTAVNTFGEFTSPSDVDVANYYNETLGRLSPMIQEAAADPDKFKDASFRARWNTALNSLNYANISRLQQGAENLRQRQKNVAEMIANGTYNANWDRYADLSNYDTLQSGILEELSPIKWMDANTLSNRYFDNLQPTDLNQTTRNGVRYNVQGISYDTLYNIADARFNDLVRTPQGAEYYREFLQQYGNPEQARAAFVGMVADSQKDRERYLLTVDPAWLAQLRAAASSNRGKGSAAEDFTPMRLNFIRQSFIANSGENIKKVNTEEQLVEQNRIESILATELVNAQRAYNANPTDENLAKMQDAGSRFYNQQGSFIMNSNRQVMASAFEEVTGHSPYEQVDEENFHSKDFLKGVNKALSEVETPLAITKDDAIVARLSATPIMIQDASGSNKPSYQFNTSEGFILPETAYKMIGSTREQPVVGRNVMRGGWFGSENDMGFQEALEGGRFGDVQFIPSPSIIQVSPDTYAIKGKVRISEQNLESTLGTGTYPLSTYHIGRETSKPGRGFIGTERLDNALFANYDASKVKEKVGDDEVTYYEFDTYRLLPSTTTGLEWWMSVSQAWQNSPNYGGIGGAGQASDAYGPTAEQFLQQ